MPRPRSALTVAAAGGKIYAIGGQSSDGNILNSNIEYDPVTGTWSEKAPMPTPRYAAAVAVVKDVVYVFT
jgi:hypothetical protein